LLLLAFLQQVCEKFGKKYLEVLDEDLEAAISTLKF
jgi:hypothetical protein